MLLIILCLCLVFLMIGWSELRKNRLINQEHLKLLETESLTDKLTGLGNRRAFDAKASEIQQDPERFSDAILVMLDVNGLKFTNDTYGHNAGDELIESAARCLTETIGKDNLCYRIGGDEFFVILHDYRGSLPARIDSMKKWIARYNENVVFKLSLAHGESPLKNADGSFKSISDWKQSADINMYNDKRITNTGKTNILAEEYQDIIRCIISILETRSELNFQHSARVKAIAGMLCQRLHLSEHATHQIEHAAVLHDIGKLSIPDEILLKTTPLNDGEYEIIKQHPSHGAQIFSHTNTLVETADIILHHHERFDGSGYPDGLAGNNIPLGSRIIAIADSIDAMTSKRAYRNAFSLDVCKEEIRSNLGSMYDPEIGQLVLDSWDEIVKIILSHPNNLD